MTKKTAVAERISYLRLISGADVAAIDACAAALGTPGAALMARAGAVVAEQARDMIGASSGRMAILVGPGANGGDGYVAARLLAEDAGFRIIVIALGAPKHPDARAAKADWEQAGGAVLPWGEQARAEIAAAGLIIDALVRRGPRARSVRRRGADGCGG